MASPSTLPLTSAFPSPSRRLAASRRATSLVIVAQGKVKKYRQVGSPHSSSRNLLLGPTLAASHSLGIYSCSCRFVSRLLLGPITKSSSVQPLCSAVPSIS